MYPTRPLGQPSSGVCEPNTAIDSPNSLKKAFCLFKISPGSIPSCAAHDYPFLCSMKGILKQFCSVTVVIRGSSTVGQQQL